MDNRVVVDPLHLTEETNQLLLSYLKRWMRHGCLIAGNKTHFYKFTRFTLTHDLLIREKSPGIWHVDVIATENSGCTRTGFLYPVLAVISVTDISSNTLTVERKNKRIYLSQNKDGKHEFSLMRRCSHLKARGLFSGIPSLISIRKPKGERLIEILNKDRRVPFLTIEDRYRMTIGLLRALQTQIHQPGICKKDIKPDTIYYDQATNDFFFYELDIAKLMDDHSDLRARGNVVFSSPEEFTSIRTEKPVTEREFLANVGMKSMTNAKSDVFSVARVLGLIWHDVDSIFTDKYDVNDLMLKRIRSGWKAQFKLFHRLPQLAKEDQSPIQNLLELMARPDGSERPCLDACIRQFQNIFLAYQLKNIPKDLHENINLAHQSALNYISVMSGVDHPLTLIEYFERAVNDLPDDDYSINYFISALGAKCMSGISLKSTLITKAKAVHELYLECQQLLIIRRDALASSGKIAKLNDLNRFIGDIHTTNITLDKMVEHVERMQLKLFKLEEGMVHESAELKKRANPPKN